MQSAMSTMTDPISTSSESERFESPRRVIDSREEATQEVPRETCQRAADILVKWIGQNRNPLSDCQEPFVSELNPFQQSINDMLFCQIFGYVLDDLF